MADIHQLRVLFPNGQDELFVGERVLVYLRDGILVVTVHEGHRVSERAWPAGQWSEYRWEGVSDAQAEPEHR